MKLDSDLAEFLREKALWVWKETLKIHRVAPGTRVASSLSCVEIFTVLYYGKILRFDQSNTQWEDRDRLIASKGHGAISLYPILADLGFFDKKELERVGKEGSFLGGIPDPIIPGFETVNGALGHGPGVACGMALALKRKGNGAKIFVVLGDGELFEGAVWEAMMFASQHRLDNLIAIVDNNKRSMLDYCKNIIDLEPLEDKFENFGWISKRVNGHNIEELYDVLKEFKYKDGKPKVIIADTIKGKGVPQLEKDPICHVKSLTEKEIDDLLEGLK